MTSTHPAQTARSLRLLITAALAGLLVGAWFALDGSPRPNPDDDLRRSGEERPTVDADVRAIVPPALRITVVDTLELPVAGVRLQALETRADSPAIASTETDRAGTATLTVPPDRTLLLAIDAPEFPSQVLALRPLAEDEIRRVPITLGSRRGIAVQVTDERERPIATATVRATPGPRPDGPDNAVLTRTDDAGVGTLSALGSGSWVLTVQAAGYELARIPIGDGPRAPASVPVQLHRTEVVRGTVRDAATGRPATRAEVRARWESGAERTARVVQGGTFEMPRPSGAASPARITVTIPDVGIWSGPAPATTRWDLELPLGGRVVRGTVRAGGRPVVGAEVAATADTASRGGRGFPWNDGWWRPRALSAADGTFALRGIPAGRFEVTATSQGRNAASGSLAEASEPIPLALASPGGLAGRVTSRIGPTKDVMIDIFAAPAEPLDGPVAELRTDRLGRFAAELVPGTYRVRAQGPDGIWVSEALQIRAGERRSLAADIRLGSGHTVSGRVQDPDMAERGPALVTLVPDDPVLPTHQIRTAPDGSFSVDRISPGSYSAFYSFPADPWARRASTAARSRVNLRVPAPDGTSPVLLQPIR